MIVGKIEYAHYHWLQEKSTEIWITWRKKIDERIQSSLVSTQECWVRDSYAYPVRVLLTKTRAVWAEQYHCPLQSSNLDLIDFVADLYAYFGFIILSVVWT